MVKRPVGPASPSSLRHWNEQVVHSALSTAPQKISELVARTGLTPPAVGEVLRGLEEKGWAKSSEPTGGGRGRPAQYFTLQMPKGCVIGVDIGAHAIRLVALDLWGKVLGTAEDRLHEGANAVERKQMIREIANTLLEETGSLPIWSTVITVPGQVSSDGIIVNSIVLPEWMGKSPESLFGDVFKSPVYFANDVRSAAWAERKVGRARGYADILFVRLGRRPSLGVVIGNTIRVGATGFSGDLSKNSLLPSEEHMDWFNAYPADDRLGHATRAALQGDSDAIDAVVRYIESIAPALSLAIAVVDPEIVVIGGPPAPLAPYYLPQVIETVKNEVLDSPIIVASDLDQFSSALGGALIGIKRIKDLLLSPDHGAGAFTLENFHTVLAHQSDVKVEV